MIMTIVNFVLFLIGLAGFLALLWDACGPEEKEDE